MNHPCSSLVRKTSLTARSFVSSIAQFLGTFRQVAALPNEDLMRVRKTQYLHWHFFPPSWRTLEICVVSRYRVPWRVLDSTRRTESARQWYPPVPFVRGSAYRIADGVGSKVGPATCNGTSCKDLAVSWYRPTIGSVFPVISSRTGSSSSSGKAWVTVPSAEFPGLFGGIEAAR